MLLSITLLTLGGYKPFLGQSDTENVVQRVQAAALAATVTPTACARNPINPPSAAVYNLDHQAADWGVFCEGTPQWTLQNASSPSLDGEALQCAIAGGSPYSNVHCYRDLLLDPASNTFILTLSFRMQPATSCNNHSTASVIQAIEFSTSKWYQSKRYEFAFQWENIGVGAPQWRYWNPNQPPGKQWVPLSPPVTQCLESNVWHTLTFEGDMFNDRVHYNVFTIDTERYVLDVTIDPFPSSAHDHVAVAVQLDGNDAETPYELYLDTISLVRAAEPTMPTASTTPTATITPTAPLTPTATITPTMPAPVEQLYFPLIVRE